MSKLTELLTRRDKLQSDLEAARVNAPEKKIEHDLEAVQSEIDQANQEQSKRELEAAQAKNAQLEKDIMALHGRIVAYGAALQPEVAELHARIMESLKDGRRWPNDLSNWRFSDQWGFVKKIAEDFAGYARIAKSRANMVKRQ
jgi:chromosome segregation ATPase